MPRVRRYRSAALPLSAVNASEWRSVWSRGATDRRSPWSCIHRERVVERPGSLDIQHDRVMGIGLVHLTEVGASTWTTLVNPQRDVQGRLASTASRHETFSTLPRSIRWRLTSSRHRASRTIVARESRFDTAFLDCRSFPGRCGLDIRPPTPSRCTMELSGWLRRGCMLGSSVTAAPRLRSPMRSSTRLWVMLAPWRACSAGWCPRSAGRPLPWSRVLTETRSHWWPTCGPMADRSASPQSSHPSPTGCLAGPHHLDAPRNPTPAVDAYLSVLEQALLDGYLSAHEEDALVGLALSFGLARDHLAAIHMTYIDAMALAAWADGIVTDSERDQLREISYTFGTSRLVRGALRSGGRSCSSRGDERQRHSGSRPGDQVVFTRDLSVPTRTTRRPVQQSGLVVGGINKARSSWWPRSRGLAQREGEQGTFLWDPCRDRGRLRSACWPTSTDATHVPIVGRTTCRWPDHRWVSGCGAVRFVGASEAGGSGPGCWGRW